MRKAYVGKIGFLLMPLFLVAIGFPLRKYFDQPIDLDKTKTGKELATVVETDGQVLLRHKDQSQFAPAVMDDAIQNKDQLRIESGGRAKIKLASGTEVELTENSDVIFELWSQDSDESPLYLHFFAGDYRVTNLDRSRPIYVSMNDNLFLIQNKSKETAARKLTIRPTSSALGRDSREQIATPESEEEVKLVEQNTDGPPNNSYIDQTIATQKSLFQKCQTNSIRNKKQSKGHVTAGITISPTGLVSEAKMLNTNFKDLELPNCAIDVIRRLKFKAYQGDSIVRSYPLQFE